MVYRSQVSRTGPNQLLAAQQADQDVGLHYGKPDSPRSEARDKHGHLARFGSLALQLLASHGT
jgi:hypothetical protein